MDGWREEIFDASNGHFDRLMAGLPNSSLQSEKGVIIRRVFMKGGEEAYAEEIVLGEDGMSFELDLKI